MKFLIQSKMFMVAMLATAFAFTSCSKDDDDTEEPKKSMTYNYNLSAAYSGTHSADFNAVLKVTEIDANSSKVEVTLNNTVDGEMYMIHSHDAADASTTPNGTPYNETPNGDVLVQMATGNGGSVTVSQTAKKSYTELTSTYNAF
ncbi:MAG: hypothetical protein ACPF9D_10175, partial [Owenweeksia sp.]